MIANVSVTKRIFNTCPKLFARVHSYSRKNPTIKTIKTIKIIVIIEYPSSLTLNFKLKMEVKNWSRISVLFSEFLPLLGSFFFRQLPGLN